MKRGISLCKRPQKKKRKAVLNYEGKRTLGYICIMQYARIHVLCTEKKVLKKFTCIRKERLNK